MFIDRCPYMGKPFPHCGSLCFRASLKAILLSPRPPEPWGFWELTLCSTSYLKMKCPGAGPHSYVIHYGTQKCPGWGGQAANEHSLCPGNIKIDTQDMQHLWNTVLSLLSGGRSIAGSLSASGSDAMFTWLALFNLWGWPHLLIRQWQQ